MNITIHQPDFMPWMGYFHKWMQSDLLVIYDDAQFIKGGWQNRDKIRINGEAKWLTVPVESSGKLGQNINEVQISYKRDWIKDHLNTFNAVFRKSKNFDQIFTLLREIYVKRHSRLFELNMDILNFIAGQLEIEVPILMSSSLNIQSSGTQKLIEILKTVDATSYLTGMGSKEYMDESIMTDNNISVSYQSNDSIMQHYSIKEENLFLSAIEYLFRVK
jgi:hypothetical protein